MNSAINFSRFAYKSTKPRLTFYQPGDKENRPDGRNPPSPINAIPETTSARRYTPTSVKELSVVPETPDDEWPMKRANNSRAPAMASGKRKRWRVPSSSEEEIENECESRETGKGGARGTKCGLFSSTVVSKRQKRCGEPTYSINKCAPALTSNNNIAVDDTSRGNAGPHFKGSLSQRNVIDLCTDSESEFSQSEDEGGIAVSAKCKVSEVNSDSETENDVQTSRIRHPRPKPAPRRVPSPTSDGWLTRRGRLNQGSKPPSKPSSAPDSTPDIEVDVCRLRELFPQHSDEYLRESLNVCSDVDGAIAHILASDGPTTSPKRPPRASRMRVRRLCPLSDDSPDLSNSDGEESSFPDTTCAKPVTEETTFRMDRRSGRRLMLNEEDTPLHIRHRNSHRPVLLTSDSSSDGEGEGEGEGSAQSNTQHSENAVPDELTGTKPFPMVPRSKLLSFAYRKSQLSANGVEERLSVEREMEPVEGKEETGGRCEEERRGGLCEEGRESVDGEEIGRGCEEERRGGLCEEGREPVEGEEEIEGECEEGREGGYKEEKEALVNNTACSTADLTDIGVSCDMERGGSPDIEILEGHLSEESHFSDENDFTARQKTSILSLLNDCSREEARAIRGCSDTKAALLLARRPFQSWEHLLEVISSTKGLSEQLLDGCVCLIEECRMLARLLSECQSISSSIEKLVDTVREKKDQGCQSNAVVHFTLPKILNQDLVLKPYQSLGVSWLALLHSQNLNAILADEMGLGKTVQAIAFLSHLYEQGWRRPHLIVVPSSTLDNWARELARWSPSLNVLTYWGSMSERADMRDEVMYGDRQDYYDVILSTYTICIGRAEDRKFFRKLQLKTLVLDEGHMLKNMSTLKYSHLMRIQAERRLLLTGTPLQNNLLELMSLLSFVMPSVFRPYLQHLQTAFRHSHYTTSSEAVGGYHMEQVSRAKEIMRPFILRRLKREVLHQLPDKLESVEHCTLTPEQWRLYCSEVEQGRREMKDGNGKELIKSMAVLTNLRKAANHPLLLRNHYSNDIIAKMSVDILKEEDYRDADSKLVEEDMRVMTDFELHNLCLLHQSLQQYCLPGEKIRESGKFKYLEEKLSVCKEQGNRVLLFSQFTMMLDIMEAWLQLLGHTHLRLDGSTPMNERQGLIDLYNSNADILVFLLSTKAGGLGINLTSANTVVLHDIDFNPYNDKQAEDRCHRVGQTREVEVVRLVGKDTIEEEILKCAQQKLKLEQDMTSGSQLSKTDISFLLSHSLKLTQSP